MRNNNIATFKIETMDVGGNNPSETVDPGKDEFDWNDLELYSGETSYHPKNNMNAEELHELLASKKVGAKIFALDAFDEAA